MAEAMKRQLLNLTMCLLFSGSLIGQNQEEWTLRADPVMYGDYDYAGVTVANGMIGIVSSPHPFQVKDVIMAGAFDVNGRGRVSNFIKSFNVLNMFLEVNRHRLSAANVSGMKQELNMLKAYFSSKFDFEDKVSVQVTYRSLRHLPFCVLMDVEIAAHEDLNITTGTALQAPDALRSVQNYHNEIVVEGGTIDLLTSSAKSPSGRLDICASNALLFDDDQKPTITHEILDYNHQRMRFSKKMKKGEIFRFSVVSSMLTTAHQADPLNEAERMTIYASLQGRDRLVRFHEREWQKLWQTGDIQVAGDKQTQQDLRNMLYHLYAFTREGFSNSLSPMGLSGLGYNGHVFWDTEIWMYPALLVLQPQLARSLVDYRFDRLDAAKRNAKMHGYRGAMFPWESAATGDEETPVWALSGPFEHHITACVAIAAWQYYCVTQDKEWLATRGWPVLEATADFWLSRVERDPDGVHHIRNVVGADEWAENVDNDAWTNAAAKANLMYAAKAAEVLEIEAHDQWAEVAASIPVLKFENGVIREHASYEGEPIKQADATLTAYPLSEVSDEDQILATVDYYMDKVPGVAVPAMTKSINALLYARCGKTSKAYEVFLDGYRPNMWGPFRVVMETPGSYNPYFATAAGGILQAVMMGFGGLNITDKGIVHDKVELPKQWKSLKLIGVGPEDLTIEINN